MGRLTKMRNGGQAMYDILRGSGMTIAVAESCTGGLVTDVITDVPGSSEYFVLGVTAYADRAKIDVLGVHEDTLARYGAVSAEVAEQMACGAAEAGNASYAVSTTGIAGPGGATSDKPVGLVYIGFAGPHGGRAIRFEFDGDRRSVKEQAARAAIERFVQFIRDEMGLGDI
jgi:nicotinamide-nucleotide amidase